MSSLGSAIGDSIASSSMQGQGPWSAGDYRNGSDIESDNFNPASAYGYCNGGDVESDAYRSAASSLAGDGDGPDDVVPVRLGPGRYLWPNGRIQTSTVTVSDPVEQPWYVGGKGPVYKEDGRLPFYGLARNTRYEVTGAPAWAREGGGSLAYTFDSVGQPFWRTESGKVMNIPAPYALPKLSELQGSALWGGIKDGVYGLPSLPSKFVEGVGNLLTGNFTVDSLIHGTIESSPVGFLLAAADDDYRAAGQRLVGTGVGLAGGIAFERVALPAMAKGATKVWNYGSELVSVGRTAGNAAEMWSLEISERSALLADPAATRSIRGSLDAYLPEGELFSNRPSGVNEYIPEPRLAPTIPKHLTSGDGFTQQKGVSGAHNRDDFIAIAQANNLPYIETPAGIPGVSEMKYKIPAMGKGNVPLLDANGLPIYKTLEPVKTVYDPAIISDARIIQLGREAALGGYNNAFIHGMSQYNASAGGISFRVYMDPKTGLIRNYHPR